MRARFLGAAVVVALSVSTSGCMLDRPSYDGPWIHCSLYEDPPRALPERVLLFPARAAIGATQEVEGSSRIVLDLAASDDFGRTIDRVAGPWLAEHRPLEVLAMPELEPSETACIEAHLDLFRAVARAASSAGNGFGTPRFKLREFDYTLGPGLSWLRERSGVDAALVLYGVGLQEMRDVFVGIVDLSSGDLLWLHESPCPDEEALHALLERTWKAFPGFEAFTAVRRFS